MVKEFNSGFTQNSYFNILMTGCKVVYDNAVNNSINSKNNTKGLDFAYVEDENINALVYFDSSTGYDYMRINTGAIIEIFAYFKSAFCNKNVFSSNGDILKENENVVQGKFETSSYSILYTGEPQSDERRLLSDYASLFTLRFIFTHELGHLLNGHSYYLTSFYATKNIEMRGKKFFSNFNKNFRENYGLDRRTLEMDADAFATTTGMDNVIMLYKNADKNQILFKSLKKQIEVFKLWAFGIHSLFLLFEGMGSTTYDKEGWYLPNEARITLVMSSALSVLESYIKNKILICDDELKDEIIKEISSGINEAENYYNFRFGTNFNFANQAMSNPKYNHYANEVLNHWDKTLYKKLEKYSRTYLYNPKTIEEFIKNIK